MILFVTQSYMNYSIRTAKQSLWLPNNFNHNGIWEGFIRRHSAGYYLNCDAILIAFFTSVAENAMPLLNWYLLALYHLKSNVLQIWNHVVISLPSTIHIGPRYATFNRSIVYSQATARVNIHQTRNPFETQISPDLFFLNILVSCQIVLKSCTEHGSITAVICAKYQNDSTSKKYVVDKRDFEKFGFNNQLRRTFEAIPGPRFSKS